MTLLKDIVEQKQEIKENLEKVSSILEKYAAKTKTFSTEIEELAEQEVKDIYFKFQHIQTMISVLEEDIETFLTRENQTYSIKLPKDFDTEEFLESDFGAYLIHIVEQWDKALSISDTRTSNYCSEYWSGAKDALEHFTDIEYSFSRTDESCGIVDEQGNWLFRVR